MTSLVSPTLECEEAQAIEWVEPQAGKYQACLGRSSEPRDEASRVEDTSDLHPLHNLMLQSISENLVAEIQGLPPCRSGADFVTSIRLIEVKNWASHVHLTPK